MTGTTEPRISEVTIRKEHSRNWHVAFVVLASIGALVLLSEIALHIAGSFTGRTYEIDHGVVFLGMLFGFVGFYGLDSKRAIAGGAFIVDSSVKIMNAFPVKFGRRSTDAVAIPTGTPIVPAAPPPAAPDPADTKDGGHR